MQGTAEATGIGQRRPRIELIGRTLGRRVPTGIGVVEAYLGPRPEIRPSGGPGRGEGKLAELAGAARRLDLVMAQFGHELELLGNGVGRTCPQGGPVLALAVGTNVLLV